MRYLPVRFVAEVDADGLAAVTSAAWVEENGARARGGFAVAGAEGERWLN